jgi:hypothetical protein
VLIGCIDEILRGKVDRVKVLAKAVDDEEGLIAK